MVAEGFVDISEEQDGGLLKKIIQEGVGDETPPIGSDISVHYVGTLTEDGSKFDSSRDRGREFETQIGVGQVIRGWDVGMPTMKRGEKAILRARHDYAYGEDGSPPKIPGGATLDFEVELFSWKERVKDPEDMSPAERSEFAAKQKEIGTAAFKSQDWEAAVEAYAEGAKYITFGQNGAASSGQGHSHGHGTCHGDHGGGAGDAPELGDEEKKLAIALLTNCAMARLKIGDHELVKVDCIQALQLDPKNVKALFRRGKAKLALGEHEAAMEDAAAALEVEPDNKEAEGLKKQAELEKKRAKQKEKAMYGKMFVPSREQPQSTSTAMADDDTVWSDLNGYETKISIVTEGTGATIKAKDSVTVHATGTVEQTGKKFWSTKDPGQSPFKYQAGVGGVITGWDQGCLGMAIGEVRKLRIPAGEGYGEAGFPAWDIPPGATLVFELECLKIG